MTDSAPTGKPGNREDAPKGNARAASDFRFFDQGEHDGDRSAHANDVDIWVPDAHLYVRLTPRWRGVVTRAADRFRTFRGPVRDETMVLHYTQDPRIGPVDIYVVGRKKLAEYKGSRIAIHDSERDVFVLLPEDVSEKIIAAAKQERERRTADRAPC